MSRKRTFLRLNRTVHLRKRIDRKPGLVVAKARKAGRKVGKFRRA